MVVLFFYNILLNFGLENVYMELYGVFGLFISLKYLGVKFFYFILFDMLIR